MCGRVVIVSQELVNQIIQDIIRRRTAEYLPDWPAVKRSGRPGDTLTLIVPEGDTLTSANMQWGYKVSWSKALLFNTKAETATRTEGPTLWRESLLQRRCVLPSFGFFESHKNETYKNPKTGRTAVQQYLFTLPDEPITYLAGIYEEESFSLMTTEPNDSVAPIHARMPVVLRQEELFTWLFGDYTSVFDRSGLVFTVEKETVQESQHTTRQRSELSGQQTLFE